ncbi:MAG: hypothetical protein RBR67_00425 [Desulfobacterium sp.]|jgi:translation initiation factor 1 (eIF-1/SUI1)|nr:hypothetical protein [Desulfobacterium sp.]
MAEQIKNSTLVYSTETGRIIEIQGDQREILIAELKSLGKI